MNILQECEGAKRVGISGHVRPDGDCVGSCLGLYLYLKKCLPGGYCDKGFPGKAGGYFHKDQGLF